MSLEPLRRALRAETAARAASRRSDVSARCERIVADAEETAGRLAHEGRLEGERAAGREAARRRAAAARRAREHRLAAQRRLLDELRRRSRDTVLQLRGDRGYPGLLERLSRAARAQLGDDAELEVDPPGRGGVLGRADGASVDYTLAALADRVVDGLGADLEELWR